MRDASRYVSESESEYEIVVIYPSLITVFWTLISIADILSMFFKRKWHFALSKNMDISGSNSICDHLFLILDKSLNFLITP